MSAVTKARIRPTATPVSKASLQCSATVSKTATQKQTPSVNNAKPRQQPAPTVTAKHTPLLAGAGMATQQPASEVAAKEVSEVPIVKTTSSTDSMPSQNQSSSGADSSLPKGDQIMSGEIRDDNKEASPTLSAGLDDSAIKLLPKQVQPSESGAANCKETPAVNCVDRLPTEVNRKAVDESGFTATVPPDTGSKTKPSSVNSVQQRAHVLARNSSLLIKVTPDLTNNKGQLNTPKNQVQAGRDSMRSPRVNQKIVENHPSNCLTLRKDKPADSGKKDVREESLNIVPDTEKRLEKQATSTKSTPLASNNSNRTSQQSLQIIRNNQQILKKNDEIMRCPNTIKRTTQVFQRKSQDALKACAQLRSQDDKSSSKKRCVLTTNPVKRHLVNFVDTTGRDDLEPAAKKWRPGVENNHKIMHGDQKTSELKAKCISNSNECQIPKNVTGKSDISEVTPIVPKTINSNFPLPAQLEITECQQNHGAQKNSLTDKVQSPIPLQRPAHRCHPNILSKQHEDQSRTQGPKFESLATKSDVTPPQIQGTSSYTRNVQQIPPVPVPAAAHSNVNTRLQPPSLKRKADGECNDVGALDLSASPRRQQQNAVMSIAQTLARRHQQHCPSPAPPPLSPLSSLSPFPVMSVPVRSPPPQLRIPVPHHRPGHSQQQRPSSLSSSSPSPPADTLPGCSRTGLQQQQPLDIYSSHLLTPSAVMFRQQLEMQRFWTSGKNSPNPRMEWFNDAKSFENFVKTLQQQQDNRNSSFFPYNTTATRSSHRK
jgi:hypothetical protein